MTLHELSEDEALSIVVAAIGHLFPIVSERQSRELAKSVIRRLAGHGVVLALRRSDADTS